MCTVYAHREVHNTMLYHPKLILTPILAAPLIVKDLVSAPSAEVLASR